MDETQAGITALEEAQKKKLIQDLEAKKNSNLATLNNEEQIAKPQYTQQRADKNVASQINKLNFATFSEQRGQVNSGFTNQAELSRQNMLNRNIGAINTAETTQMNDIARRRSDVNTTYNTDLASGNSAIALDTATRLLDYKEKLRQEKLAQDAETLAYERALSKSNATSGVPTWTDSNGNGINDSMEAKVITKTTPNEFAGYDMNSISSLGYGPISKAQLSQLVNSGQVIAKNVNGVIVVSKAPVNAPAKLSMRGF